MPLDPDRARALLAGLHVGIRLARADRGDLDAGRERAAHLLELGAGGHLLGVDRGLDAVEQPLEPADQLRLRDPQLGLGGSAVLGERQGQPVELLDQLGREAGLELLDGGGGGSP